MNLTKHFTLEELTYSDTAVRLGIDNTPSSEVVQHLVVLAQGLELIRNVIQHPLRVNSGFRCEELERVLTAKDYAAWCARHSRNPTTAWNEYFQRKGHPKGYCADFTCATFGTPKTVIRAVIDAGVKFDQLIEEGTWAHASFDPRLRMTVLTATFKDGTPRYTAGLG